MKEEILRSYEGENSGRKITKSISNVALNDNPTIQTLNFSLSVKFGVYSLKGNRDTQEDSHTALLSKSKRKENEQNIQSFAFFGVFDGHGGQKAADYASVYIHKYFMEELKQTKDLELALTNAIQRTEVSFLLKAKKEQLLDGTTACVVVINKDTLVYANVGDSEIIICKNNKAVVLSEIHNPKKNQKEIERIGAIGGKLNSLRLCHPVLNPQFCSIAVSRSIGDLLFKDNEYTHSKESGLIADPHVESIQLVEDIQFCIIACDGLWDVMTYQEAVDFVILKLKETDFSPQSVSELLAKKAFEKGSQDNITALIISFRYDKK
eukprot:TRINITY_DN8132_c0_g1_i1.p1 TRINITY_DN8132_c0_g1~~TRINITY_DN8132_c0_g1_i1.p1  ORF type:complete len:322 (+),score=80.13 TRINITY_DN8132_c0_g1_i1:63-1028(+)